MSTDRPSDAAIFAGVATTLREVVIPALERDGGPADTFTRVTAVQLVGLAEYAAGRPADPAARRRQDVEEALRRLADNEVVRECANQPGADQDPLARASAVLVACVDRADPAADHVREVLRPVLVAQLDEELVSTMPLLEAFRGRLRDA